MRIERIGLEHHGDAAISRRHVVDQLTVDPKFAVGDGFQPGNHPKRGRLAATRRANQHRQRFVGDFQIDAAHGDVATVNLHDVAEADDSHQVSFDEPWPASPKMAGTDFNAGSAKLVSGRVAYQSGRPGSRSY